MKKILAILFAAVLMLTLCLTVGATSTETSVVTEIPDHRLLPRLVDNAELLSESEREEVLARLDEVSENRNFDIVIVTVNSTGGKTPTEYADDFYDYNGYGMGSRSEGLLLLISMEDRDWAISTYTELPIGSSDMMDDVLPYLGSGNYARAFETFADVCDRTLEDLQSSDDYTGEKTFSASILVIPVILGIVCGFIGVSIMKGKLKSVRFKSSAVDYIVPGSLNLTDSHEMFLYTTVTRTEIPRDDDSGGSGGGHVSSSGRSHGGSSGKF